MSNYGALPSTDFGFSSQPPTDLDGPPSPSRPSLSPTRQPHEPLVPPISSQPTTSVSGSMRPAQQSHSEQYVTNEGGFDTLDEPVSETLKRDLLNIWTKLQAILLPSGNKNVLKDWDLWGPLLLCLTLAIILSIGANEAGQTAFTSMFMLIWVGSTVVTVNSKLLGGALSFFQCVCILGYCVFPLVISAIVGIVLKQKLLRLPIVGAACFWCVYASRGFLTDTQLDKRKGLALYPIFLFYFVIGWMVLIAP